MGDLQRREFHEVLLDAGTFEDLSRLARCLLPGGGASSSGALSGRLFAQFGCSSLLAI
jgi:hypothetical protein